VELEFGNVGFYGGRKTGEPGEKPTEQGREPTTNSTQEQWREGWALSNALLFRDLAKFDCSSHLTALCLPKTANKQCIYTSMLGA